MRTRVHKGPQVMPGQALAHDDVAALMHPDTVKDSLCDGDSQSAHRALHRTRLLWLNAFTRLEILLAHGSRSAQGAGPFPYDQPLSGESHPITCTSATRPIARCLWRLWTASALEALGSRRLQRAG